MEVSIFSISSFSLLSTSFISASFSWQRATSTVSDMFGERLSEEGGLRISRLPLYLSVFVSLLPVSLARVLRSRSVPFSWSPPEAVSEDCGDSTAESTA